MLASSLMMPSAAFGSEIYPSIDLEGPSENLYLPSFDLEELPECSDSQESINYSLQTHFYQLVISIRDKIPELEKKVAAADTAKELFPSLAKETCSKRKKYIMEWLHDLKNTVDGFDMYPQSIGPDHVERAQQLLNEVLACCKVCDRRWWLS